MDDLIKLLQAYQAAKTVEERIQLGDTLICQIEADLRFFVYNAAPRHVADDLCQNILIAVATGLARFRGNTTDEFWKWCYRIARNKINDHFRSSCTEAKRLAPIPPEELWLLAENSPDDNALSAQDRHDLNHAMKLLIQAKPECYEMLWLHYILGLDYAEIAAERNLSYDNSRIKISRCLENVQALVN